MLPNRQLLGLPYTRHLESSNQTSCTISDSSSSGVSTNSEICVRSKPAKCAAQPTRRNYGLGSRDSSASLICRRSLSSSFLNAVSNSRFAARNWLVQDAMLSCWSAWGMGSAFWTSKYPDLCPWMKNRWQWTTLRYGTCLASSRAFSLAGHLFACSSIDVLPIDGPAFVIQRNIYTSILYIATYSPQVWPMQQLVWMLLVEMKTHFFSMSPHCQLIHQSLLSHLQSFVAPLGLTYALAQLQNACRCG